MKLEKLFRFWLTMSFFWVIFALILGGKLWVFPYTFHECWEKQQYLMKQNWKK